MSEWNDVNDVLPGLNIDWCIVLTKNSDECIFSFMAAYIHKEGKWEYFDENNYEVTMEVTHWMPLPEMPK